MVLLANSMTAIRPKAGTTELLITRSCMGYGIDSPNAIRHLEIGTRVKATFEEAFEFVHSNAGVFVDPEDDPTPNKMFSLTPAIQAAVNCQVQALKEREARREEDRAFQEAYRRSLIDKYGPH